MLVLDTQFGESGFVRHYINQGYMHGDKKGFTGEERMSILSPPCLLLVSRLPSAPTWERVAGHGKCAMLGHMCTHPTPCAHLSPKNFLSYARTRPWTPLLDPGTQKASDRMAVSQVYSHTPISWEQAEVLFVTIMKQKLRQGKEVVQTREVKVGQDGPTDSLLQPPHAQCHSIAPSARKLGASD